MNFRFVTRYITADTETAVYNRVCSFQCLTECATAVVVTVKVYSLASLPVLGGVKIHD